MPIQKAINQKYGTLEGVSVSDGGMYCGYGPEQVYEVIIDLVDLTETESVSGKGGHPCGCHDRYCD
jgi:hypothetical protein